MSSTPKIAIIGAGPAGLTLARILHINGVPSTVFEGEKSPTVRGQGGTLDLHEKTGQAALHKAGLYSEFQKHARIDGEDIVIADRKNKHCVEMIDQGTGRPEIDRAVLRQVLVDSIPPEYIRWGHRLQKVEAGTLHFQSGIETGFDLIVGADGAWSKVRPLLTTVSPFYSGISCVEIHLKDIAAKHPKLSEMIGRGSYFAFGEEEGRVLLCQRQGNGDVRVYCAGWKDEHWIQNCGIDFSKPGEFREAYLKEYSTWAPELQDLIRYCDDDITPRPLYMLPPGLRWGSKSGFAVMGDAAHVCTPFAGEGVNAAMVDAMVLGTKIIEHTQNLDKAVREYEQVMFQHAKRVTEKTWTNLLERFQEGGIAHFEGMFAAWLKQNGKPKVEDVKKDIPLVE